jgi:membrane fusion protein (multidrug efflux system)
MKWIAIAAVAAAAQGCGGSQPHAQAAHEVEVTAVKVALRDAPVSFEYVGQTESSRQVQIVARVSGFLEKRLYEEGALVREGQVLFLQDQKPFQASLQAADGALAAQESRLATARANLARVEPLVKLDALSRKDLDDAQGAEKAAVAAVETARANVDQAKLNLGYTRITSPVSGLSSYAREQEGAYLGPGNSLLTYVEQVDPMRVNFTLSENDLLGLRADVRAGKLRVPKQEQFEVEVLLANGETHPARGRITFFDAAFNQKTGSYLVRATVSNPQADLRPGQFVRARILGAVRPGAVVIPQRAVLQGAKGHFVMVVEQGKAAVRPVEVGPWIGPDVFIERGLAAGDVVAVDGVEKVTPGTPVKVAQLLAPGEPKVASAAGR